VPKNNASAVSPEGDTVTSLIDNCPWRLTPIAATVPAVDVSVQPEEVKRVERVVNTVDGIVGVFTSYYGEMIQKID
jgi:hypothetical protein